MKKIARIATSSICSVALVVSLSIGPASAEALRETAAFTQPTPTAQTDPGLQPSALPSSEGSASPGAPLPAQDPTVSQDRGETAEGVFPSTPALPPASEGLPAQPGPDPAAPGAMVDTGQTNPQQPLPGTEAEEGGAVLEGTAAETPALADPAQGADQNPLATGNEAPEPESGEGEAEAAAAGPSVGTVLDNSITVGGAAVSCSYFVTSLPAGGRPGTVQIGDDRKVAIDVSLTGEAVIPEKITDTASGNSYSVTKIGSGAFKGSSITGVSYEATAKVTIIKSSAFEGCQQLATTGLGSTTTVDTIDTSAFAGCSALTRTELDSNSSVARIESSAFSGCTGLATTGLAGNSTVTSLEDDAFSDSGITTTGLEKNTTLTTISDHVFENCQKLTSTGLGSNSTVTSLGDHSFAGSGITATGLEQNSTVKTLGASTFASCTALASTGLGSNSTIEVLPDDVFSGCPQLTDTELGQNSTVRSLGQSAFSSCSGLTNTGLDTNRTLTALSDSVFQDCEALTTTGLDKNTAVTTLGIGVFQGCTALTDTGLEKNTAITTVSGYTFAGCTALADTGLFGNTTVTSIGEHAFGSSAALEHAALPASLTTLDPKAFFNGKHLATIYCPVPFSVMSTAALTTSAPVVLYYLSADATWAGKKPSDAGPSVASFKALSTLTVQGGTKASPSSPWARTGLYAESESVAIDYSGSPSGFGVWMADPTAAFADAHAPHTEVSMPAADTVVSTGYQVVFEGWDGQALKTQDVAPQAAATAPVPPTRPGYTFAKWDTDFSHVESNLVVKAVYDIDRYTVTFEDWEGNPVGPPQTVDYGAAAEAPVPPTRPGYTFAKWDTDFSHVESNLVVKAEYAIDRYTVTFEDWEGNPIGPPQTVDYDTAATAPVPPARPGYTFIGWDTDFSRVESNLVVKAEYKKDPVSPVSPVSPGHHGNPVNPGGGNPGTASGEPGGQPGLSEAAEDAYYESLAATGDRAQGIIAAVSIAGIAALAWVFVWRKTKRQR